MSYRKSFGLQIKNIRKLAGLNQEQLAQRSKLSAVYVSDIERGIANPRLTAIRQLAEGLEIPVSDLFLFERRTITAGEVRRCFTQLLEETEDGQLSRVYAALLYGLLKLSNDVD